jgi:predicted transcriptional regulator
MDNVNLLFISRILRVFYKDIAGEMTIRQLSKEAKLSYNATHRTVKYLAKEGVFTIRQFGRSSVLRLSMSQKAIGYLCLEAYQETEEFLSGKKKANDDAHEAVEDDSVKAAYFDMKKGCVVALKGAIPIIDLKNMLIIKGAEAIFRKIRGGRK